MGWGPCRYYENIEGRDVKTIVTSHARREDITLPALAPSTPEEAESAAAARAAADLPPR